MTSRLSSNQYIILKSMAPRTDSGVQTPISLDKAIGFNQLYFMSLLSRGYMKLSIATETFSLTDEGLAAFARYHRGLVSGLQVKNDPPARHERVESRLSATSEEPKRKPPTRSKTRAA